MISEKERNKLKRDGYLIIKKFIDANKVAYLRKALKNFNKQETLANKKLNYFSVNNKIIKIMNYILRGKIYYPFLSIAVNNMYQTQNKKSFIHNDVRFEDFNFDNDYNIYNVGIYLQNHTDYSGGLKVRPGSHKKIIIEGQNYFKKILLFCKTVVYKPDNVSFFQILRTLLPYKSVNLKINAGDLVIWNMRLHHSGNNIRVKFIKNFSLSTYVENIIPNFMILKNSLDRFAILTVYIGEGAYKNQYINEQIKRPQHVEFWKNSNINFEILQKKIKNKNIQLVPQIKRIIINKH